MRRLLTVRMSLLVLIGVAVFFLLKGMINEETFVDGIALFFLVSIGLVIYFLLLRNDFKVYKESKNILSFMPTLIGATFVFGIMAYNKSNVNRLNSPTLLKAHYNADLGGLSIDFKQSGEWIRTSTDILSNRYQYGTYEIKDSFITIHSSNMNEFDCKKFLIRTGNQPANDGSIQGHAYKGDLICIGENGKESANKLTFYLSVDNRH